MIALLSACTSLPPKHPDNVCQIFNEKQDWYQATREAYQHWGTPIAIQLAILHQESSFIADAQPPRRLILGFIPWFRSSSAYGYPQAKDETWADYQKQSGNHWSSREDFADSCDFVAWYCASSNRKLGIPLTDANSLYLSYHEGMGGYKKATFRAKPWLIKVAQKVEQRAKTYAAQLSHCQQELEDKN